MPTRKQLSRSMESQFEFPQTRREDDPMYVKPEIKEPIMTTLLPKRLTPLQTILKWVEQSPEGHVFTRNELAALMRHAHPDEMKLLGDAYEAGADTYDRCVQPEGGCGFDPVRYVEEKEQFLNQFKQE